MRILALVVSQKGSDRSDHLLGAGCQSCRFISEGGPTAKAFKNWNIYSG